MTYRPGRKKNAFSGQDPNGKLLFSSSITVMAVTSDSHRCFPILLCFHRHHIANIQFLQVIFYHQKAKVQWKNPSIFWKILYNLILELFGYIFDRCFFFAYCRANFNQKAPYKGVLSAAPDAPAIPFISFQIEVSDRRYHHIHYLPYFH